MLERAGARLWVSIVAGAIAFPVAAVVLLAAWVIRVQIVGPSADSSPVTVAVALPISPAQQKVEAAAPPQRGVVTESIAPPTTALTPEPSSTTPIAGNATPAAADRAQNAPLQDAPPRDAPSRDARPQDALAQDARPPDALPSAPTVVAAEPAVAEPDVGAVSPTPVQVEAAKSQPLEQAAKHGPPETVGERFAPALESKTPDFTPALSVFATLAVVPPKLGAAYADPSQDASTSVERSGSISGPIPLPRPRPRVAANVIVAPNAAVVPHVTATPANVGRASPLPRSRPVGSSPLPQVRPQL